MTQRQFNKCRRWDRKLLPAYRAGFADGKDAYYEGRDCPEPLVSDYDIKRYLRRRMRWIQGVSNATIARSRGRYDGWQLASKDHTNAIQEDWIEAQVLDGLEKFEGLLREAA